MRISVDSFQFKNIATHHNEIAYTDQLILVFHKLPVHWQHLFDFQFCSFRPLQLELQILYAVNYFRFQEIIFSSKWTITNNLFTSSYLWYDVYIAVDHEFIECKKYVKYFFIFRKAIQTVLRVRFYQEQSSLLKLHGLIS